MSETETKTPIPRVVAFLTVPDTQAGARLFGLEELTDKDRAKAMEHIRKTRSDGENLTQPAFLRRVVAAGYWDGSEVHTHLPDADSEASCLEGLLSIDAELHFVDRPSLDIARERSGFLGVNLGQDVFVDASSGLIPEPREQREYALALGIPVSPEISRHQMEKAEAKGDVETLKAECRSLIVSGANVLIRDLHLRGKLETAAFKAAETALRTQAEQG